MDQQEQDTRGARIKRARKARGLTQEEVAAAVGITAKTLGNIERDGNSHVDTVAAVMAHLDLPGDPDETRSHFSADVQFVGNIVMAYLDTLEADELLAWQRKFMRDITGRNGEA